MKYPAVRTALASVAAVVAALLPNTPVHASLHTSLHCDRGQVLCTEVSDSEEVFGEGVYVGHDEPSNLFYSNVPGSGNRMRYELKLPTDPVPVPKNGRSFNFQLHPAFWFGMALCDTQSYPVAVQSCQPDSDSNIKPLAQHPGAAFMELQFYPPGWASAPRGSSCDARRYCVAIASFSLSQDPINGTQLNPICASATGIEYANYAFLTTSGHPHATPNPVESTALTFTPNPATDLFMNPGDRISIAMHDTEHGLRIDVGDQTTNQHGFMTMSASNGFGMVKYAPAPSSECTNIPYDFHPMYSTSSEQTRVIWAAHSYNVAFSDEIGHFDYCTTVLPDPTNLPYQKCSEKVGKEGVAGDRERAEGPPTATNPLADDNFCFSAAQSTLVPITGCQGTNTGFDGVSYKPLWADGNPDHAGAFFYTSPLTGADYSVQYNRVAFEADLPRIERDSIQQCNRTTGANCTLIPITDDGTPADFYPFFSIGSPGGECMWTLASDIPGFTIKDFGKNNQYGSLLSLEYLVFGGGGATLTRFNDFRHVLPNPCPAAHGGDQQGLRSS